MKSEFSCTRDPLLRALAIEFDVTGALNRPPLFKLGYTWHDGAKKRARSSAPRASKQKSARRQNGEILCRKEMKKSRRPLPWPMGATSINYRISELQGTRVCHFFFCFSWRSSSPRFFLFFFGRLTARTAFRCVNFAEMQEDQQVRTLVGYPYLHHFFDQQRLFPCFLD